METRVSSSVRRRTLRGCLDRVGVHRRRHLRRRGRVRARRPAHPPRLQRLSCSPLPRARPPRPRPPRSSPLRARRGVGSPAAPRVARQAPRLRHRPRRARRRDPSRVRLPRRKPRRHHVVPSFLGTLRRVRRRGGDRRLRRSDCRRNLRRRLRPRPKRPPRPRPNRHPRPRRRPRRPLIGRLPGRWTMGVRPRASDRATHGTIHARRRARVIRSRRLGPRSFVGVPRARGRREHRAFARRLRVRARDGGAVRVRRARVRRVA